MKFKLSLLVIHLLYLLVLEIFLRWTVTVTVIASGTIGKGYEFCICIGFCAFVSVLMYNEGFLCIFKY